MKDPKAWPLACLLALLCAALSPRAPVHAATVTHLTGGPASLPGFDVSYHLIHTPFVRAAAQDTVEGPETPNSTETIEAPPDSDLQVEDAYDASPFPASNLFTAPPLPGASVLSDLTSRTHVLLPRRLGPITLDRGNAPLIPNRPVTLPNRPNPPGLNGNGPVTPAPVPLPASGLLLGASLAALVLRNAGRRRRG